MSQPWNIEDFKNAMSAMAKYDTSERYFVVSDSKMKIFDTCIEELCKRDVGFDLQCKLDDQAIAMYEYSHKAKTP